MAEIGCRLTTVIVGLTLAGATSLEGQIGLSSGVAQVALVVRAAPHVSLPVITRARETDRKAGLTTAAVKIRFSTNSGYRLMVRSTESLPVARIWVRAVDGTFRELGPGAAVTVARGARSAGEWERELSYLLESAEEDSRLELPVRYDIVVDPTI